MEFDYLDVATKELIWDGPATWLERFGVDTGDGVEVVDSDATTLTAAADKVIKVGGARPFLVDLEPHSYYDVDLVRKLWLRQVVLDHRHKLPVLTVLVLLHKRANSPSLRGVYDRCLPDGRLMNRYHYRVVRLWKEDPEDYLNAGSAVVPLAPLTNVSKAALPGLIARMGERINAEPRPRVKKLWDATYFLMGLRYPKDLVEHLLEGVADMHASSTVQGLLEDGMRKGRLEEAQRIVLRQGTAKFGAPDADIVAAVQAIGDIDRLEGLTERMVDPATRDWDDLLQGS